jgi:TPR repeat protein
LVHTAAERGHADALNDLATSLSRGEGVVRDESKAFEYFLMAAERGSAAAQQNTAKYYERGLGTPADAIKARYWYEQADASIYGKVVRRIEAQTFRAPQQIKSLPEKCKPTAPPIAAMNRESVDFVSGNIHVFVDGEGKFRGVRVGDLTAEALRYEIVAVFSGALRAQACRAEGGVTEAAVQIPFQFILIP